MPLDRAHLTPAERVTVWLYPSFSLSLGIALLLTRTPFLLQTPAFRTAEGVMPMHTWGGLFLIIGLVQLAAKFLNVIEGYIGSLGLLFAAMLTWAVVFSVGAWHGQNPWTAALFPAFVAGACVASITGFLSKVR